MSSLEQRSAEAGAPPPRFAQAVGGLRSGQALTWLCAEDPAVRSALVESVIDAVADLETRFVRAGNPLRAPLTMERLLIQAIGPEADLRNSRDPAAVTRLLATPLGDETRVILVVEQAETLDADSLELLERMAPHLEDAEPRVQFLLAAPHIPVPDPEELEAEVAPALWDPAPLAEPAPRRRLLPFLLAALVLVLGIAGAGVFLASPSVVARAKLYLPERFRSAAATQPIVPASVTPPQAAIPAPRPQAAVAAPRSQPAVAPPQPAPLAPLPPPPAPVSQAVAAPAPAAPPVQQPVASPPVADPAAMRHDFDDFLARSGDSASRLTDAQRSDLFQQFLAWRRAQGEAR